MTKKGPKGRWRVVAVVFVAVVLLLAAALALAPAWDRAEDLRQAVGASTGPAPDAEAIARGAYLARLGNCAGCHTPRGGAEWAGGRVIATPFGGVAAANLTPDPDTGIGRWSAEAFIRALREGRSADGRALVPACPYPNYSLLDERDLRDLYAYARSLPPVRQARSAHGLRWPFGTEFAIAAWRRLFFERATLAAAPLTSDDAALRRGAYLVGGLGHCSACHSTRNLFGANAGAFDLRGGAMPETGWLAPSLLDPRAAGAQSWSIGQTAALLRDGVNRHASVSGPMALVVAQSTQHLRPADAEAIAAFLHQLPVASDPAAVKRAPAPEPALRQLGERVFERHCADCHGKDGRGEPGAGPPLQGNRALALPTAANVVRMVLAGGFGPSTAAAPRPLGMPPFATLLSDEEVAAVVTWIRWQYGDASAGVRAHEVNRLR